MLYLLAFRSLMKAYGDSKLVVNQVKGEYEVRHEDLVPYYYAVIKIANLHDGFYTGHVSGSQNTKAVVLAALAATLALPIDTTYHLTVATRHLVCPKHVLKTKEVHSISTDFEPRDWRFSSLTMLCMIYCRMTLKKQRLSDESLSVSTIIQ